MVLVAQSELHWNRVWVLYAVVAVQSACFAVNNPARSAIIPRLVRPELLPAANTLSQAAFNLGFTAGPLLGAVVIAWQGFGAAYLVDVLTFTAALYALFRLPPVPPTGLVRRAGLRSVLEGFSFLRAAPALLATFVADILAMVFAQPRALFPAVAGGFFAGGVRTVGLLQAAPAIGALVGVLFSGWVSRVRRQGVAIVVAITVYATAVGLFRLSRTIWLGVALLALSGCGGHGQLGVPEHRLTVSRPGPDARSAPGRLHRGRRVRPEARRLRGRYDGLTHHPDDRAASAPPCASSAC